MTTGDGRTRRRLSTGHVIDLPLELSFAMGGVTVPARRSRLEAVLPEGLSSLAIAPGVGCVALIGIQYHRVGGEIETRWGSSPTTSSPSSSQRSTGAERASPRTARRRRNRWLRALAPGYNRPLGRARPRVLGLSQGTGRHHGDRRPGRDSSRRRRRPLRRARDRSTRGRPTPTQSSSARLDDGQFHAERRRSPADDGPDRGRGGDRDRAVGRHAPRGHGGAGAGTRTVAAADHPTLRFGRSSASVRGERVPE